MLTFESIYTRKVGGLAEVPPRLAEAMKSMGEDVEIYTPSHGFKKENTTGKEVFKTWINGSEYSIWEYNAPVKHYIVSGGVLEEPIVYSRNLLFKSLVFARIVREYFNHVAGRGETPDIVHGHDWHSYPALLAVNAESTRMGIPVGIVYQIHLLSRTLIDLEALAKGIGVSGDDYLRGGLGVKPLKEYYERSGGWVERLAALTSDKVLTVSKGYTRDVVRIVGLDNATKVDYVFNATTWTWDDVVKVVSKIAGGRDLFSHGTRKLVRGKLLRDTWRLIEVENPDPHMNDVIRGFLEKYDVSVNEPFKQDGPLILLTGRSTKQKGIDILLKSMDKLVSEIPRARVVLAVIPVSGTEELLREIIEYVALFPDNLRVLPGYVDYEHYLTLYYSASVFLAPSRYEPFGLVVLEAMASGTPVVASNTGGFRDLILDVRRYGLNGTGMLFTPLDREGMIEALTLMLDIVENEDESSARLRRRCVEYSSSFTWSNSAARLLGIYNALLKPRGSRDENPGG